MTEKLAYCTLTLNNQIYTLLDTWLKSFNQDKATKFILGINFIRQQSGRIIIQRDLVTIFKKSDVICTTPILKHNIMSRRNRFITQ